MKRFTGSEIERHPLYGTWVNMKCRCYVKSNPIYLYYGGRGITVCDRWLTPGGEGFWNFVKDVGERPQNPEWWTGHSHYYSLDRIDVNGNYEPKNCRWATYHQQASNKRVASKRISWNEKDKHWDARVIIDKVVFRKRVKSKDVAMKFLEGVLNEHGIQ